MPLCGTGSLDMFHKLRMWNVEKKGWLCNEFKVGLVWSVSGLKRRFSVL